MKNISYKQFPEFNKDLKRLQKRYKTILDDFERAKKLAIELYHSGIDNRACFEIPGFSDDCFSVFKLKKFACRALKGGANSGIRIIYIFDKKSNKIYFVEMYYKGDKSLEDREKIKLKINFLHY